MHSTLYNSFNKLLCVSLHTFYKYCIVVFFFFSLSLLVRPVVLWIGLCVLMLLIRITITIGIASTTIFVNNSVTFDKLGSLNGLTTMMVSAFRYALDHCVYMQNINIYDI